MIVVTLKLNYFLVALGKTTREKLPQDTLLSLLRLRVTQKALQWPV